MNSRQGAAAVVAIVLAVIIGVLAYQAGMAQGLATAGQVVVADGPRHYGPGFGFGGIFGILGAIFFLFLIFGLMRVAFWGGPRAGGGPWMDRRTMFEEWHQKAHAERTGTQGPGTPRAT